MMRNATAQMTLVSMIALAAGLGSAGPAHAQSSEQINTIQRQIRQLQRELTQMKRALSSRDAALHAAQAQAARAQRQAQQAEQQVERIPVNPFPAPPAAPPGPGQLGRFVGQPPVVPSSMGGPSPAFITSAAPKPVFQVGGLTVSLGGFVALEGYYRSPAEITSIGTSLSGIPLPNDVRYHQGNFGFSSQQSRVAALVQGEPDPVTKILGYVEADFLGAAPTANSNESNSYTPRMRQYFGEYDRSDWGFHLDFGQMWSLATLYKVGLMPRHEDVPLTIDAQYNVGFTWKRQAGIRLSEDFLNHTVWLGASVENPTNTFYVGPNGAGVPGATVTTSYTGVAQLDPGTTYSSNEAPDIVLKAAFDPGYGHYEVYGLGRFEKSNVTVSPTSINKVAYAGGVGGGMILPLLHNAVQLQASALYGAGIGTYGSGQLPDATVGRDGEPIPIPEVQAMVGLIGHPIKSVDIYGYVGTEQESRSAFANAGKGYGYGSPLYMNAGCGVVLSPLACTANTSGLVEGTIGEWWRWLSGPWGTMALGTQYSYVRRNVFAGVGGTPKANENIFMLSMRYYPFQ